MWIGYQWSETDCVVEANPDNRSDKCEGAMA